MRFADVFVVFFVSYVQSKELPPFLHICNRSDPDFEKCMIQSVEDLRPVLRKGDPDYHIPSIEPLFIDNLMSENLTDMLLNVSSVKAYGCSEYQITNIHMDFDTMDCNFDIDIPVLRIEADYNIDGKLIMIPIKGKGVFDANITNVAAKASLNGDLINKNGANHLHYSTINLKVKVGGGNVKMETYHSDKVFRQIVNDVVNKNFALFMNELLPPIQHALSQIFLNTGNEIVGQFTYEQLFPK